MNKKNSSGIVYSTNPNHQYDTKPHQAASVQPGQQSLTVMLDRKNRGGKMVTVISGFAGKEQDLDALARTLKTKCGVGGAVKDGLILLQGDHRDKVIAELSKAGYKVKKSGG